MQRHKNRELKINLLTVSMKNTISFSAEAKKTSEYSKITDFFISKMDSKACINFKNAINTESNLSSKVLKEISWCLGVDYSPFEIREKFIDSHLLGRRNSIAHGQHIDICAKQIQ